MTILSDVLRWAKYNLYGDKILYVFLTHCFCTSFSPSNLHTKNIHEILLVPSKSHAKIQKNLIVLINDRNFQETQAFFGMGRIYKRRRTNRETPALRKKKNIFQKTPEKIRSVQKINFRKKKIKNCMAKYQGTIQLLRNLLFHKKNVLWSKKKPKT